MATAFPLSPEEQVMGAIGAPSVGSAGPGQFSGYDLTGALQAGLTPADIAQGMASQIGYRYEDARRAGVTDEQIIAGLMGENAFTAGMKQFIQAGGSSIKGLAQLGGQLDTERALAERRAADIAAANNRAADIAGFVAGSILDPVALPAFAVAPLRAATATGTLAMRGAAQGAFAGLLEPTLTPEDSVVKNILLGTTLGAGFGAGVGKLIDKMGAKAADVADPVKAAEDASLTKQASKTAIEDLTRAVAPEQEDLVGRLNKLKEERTILEERLATGEPRPVAEELTPMQRMFAEGPSPARPVTGEMTPTQRLFAEGFTGTPRPVTGELTSMQRMFAEGPTAPRAITGGAQALTPMQRAALEGPQVEGMSAARMAALEGPTVSARPVTGGPAALTETQRMFLRGPDGQTTAAQQRLAKVNEEIASLEKSVAQQVPLTPAETQTIARLQKVLDDNGFKSMDEAIVATGKPEEVAAAQARIDSGNVQTLEQIVRGFRSGGSAAVTPERLYAGTTVFPDVERAVVGAVMGEKAPKLKIETVKDQEVNKLLDDFVGFLGKDLKKAREGGDFSGTLKGTIDAGIQVATKAAREEGSFLAWLFKQDENGNFVNIDKSWGRGEIAAFMPLVRDATRIYNRLMDEAVELNVKGDLSDEALQTIMEKMAYPVQIMGIFQAKRTQASRALNAFKTLDASIKNKETIKGFMKAGIPCT